MTSANGEYIATPPPLVSFLFPLWRSSLTPAAPQSKPRRCAPPDARRRAPHPIILIFTFVSIAQRRKHLYHGTGLRVAPFAGVHPGRTIQPLHERGKK